MSERLICRVCEHTSPEVQNKDYFPRHWTDKFGPVCVCCILPKEWDKYYERWNTYQSVRTRCIKRNRERRCKQVPTGQKTLQMEDQQCT